MLFLRQLEVTTDYDDITIDARSIGFVEPFGTLLIAQGLKYFLFSRRRKKRETTFLGIEETSGPVGYLKNLGFFRYVGLSVGKAVDEAHSTPRFLPLTTIHKHQIMWKGKFMQAVIDTKSEQLARVIFPGPANDGPAMMLSYSLREIIRNSFEHGGVDKCVAMGQRWASGEAEIAIADEGIGIHAALSRIRKLDSAENAISAALLPGVTSGSVQDANEWNNSGFGLYVVSELARMFGKFEISSSGCLVTIDHENRSANPSFPYGTMVGLKLNTEDADYFPNILFNIVATGEKLTDSIEGAVKSASRMSKTLVGSSKG